MNTKRKSDYQERKIKDLEKQIADLTAENNILSQEVKHKQHLLELKDRELNDSKKAILNMEFEYSEKMEEIKSLYIALNDAIKQARNMSSKFKTESKTLIERMRKQK